MQVILFMAQTINGYIARKSGEEDFLSEENWEYFVELAEEKGCFVIGRKTYEEVLEWEEKGFSDVNADRIVVSSQENLDLKDGFLLANSPEEVIRIAEEKGNDSVILTGGSGLNSSFLSENMVNQVFLNVEPYILGEGIPLFDEIEFGKRASLDEVDRIGEEILQLRYQLS